MTQDYLDGMRGHQLSYQDLLAARQHLRRFQEAGHDPAFITGWHPDFLPDAETIAMSADRKDQVQAELRRLEELLALLESHAYARWTRLDAWAKRSAARSAQQQDRGPRIVGEEVVGER